MRAPLTESERRAWDEAIDAAMAYAERPNDWRTAALKRAAGVAWRTPIPPPLDEPRKKIVRRFFARVNSGLIYLRDPAELIAAAGALRSTLLGEEQTCEDVCGYRPWWIDAA